MTPLHPTLLVFHHHHHHHHPATAAARVEEDLLTESVKVIVNLNAFAILAENKRVHIDIAVVVIADNIVKILYKYFTQSLAKYLYYIDILYRHKMPCGEMTQQQSQQGGSRRRRRTTRKNKTRRNGKCRACRCPSGCKRSTCPCYRGRSKPCCTKRCRSRGRICRC